MRKTYYVTNYINLKGRNSFEKFRLKVIRLFHKTPKTRIMNTASRRSLEKNRIVRIFPMFLRLLKLKCCLFCPFSIVFYQILDKQIRNEKNPTFLPLKHWIFCCYYVIFQIHGFSLLPQAINRLNAATCYSFLQNDFL